MSTASRKLDVGDWAVTDYNIPQHVPSKIPIARVQIVAVERDEGSWWKSQSGVRFQVRPTLRNGAPDSWYDADWFEPCKPPNVRANRPWPHTEE